ncbi:efflux RND transporter periplasmic adaptor subunit [Anatilimnocola floriformis]|uniref:efflux RND transporter periplasmic adaptor subunit n=1 Tax=Anatilimnocola floriformis TaxID=2948575 RepID=UPI0020C38969|nr:efflux RND transporter periplasmic adaptor subunit [Anatilimnocola floriformis]
MSILRKGLFALVAVVATLGVAWLVGQILASKPTASKGAAHLSAAKVQVVKEEDLGLVKLAPEALARLGVRVDKIERKPVKRSRVYGAEIVVPAGRTILVSAPLPGALQSPPDTAPQPGALVKKGQAIFLLSPFLSPEAATTFAAGRADAEGQVNNAKTQVTALKLAFERAQSLFKNEAGSRRSVEEAQAQFDGATRSLEAAETRLKVLTQAVGDAATGRAQPIPIESPDDGLLRNISASPGQNVPVGGALFEVISLAQVWVRVPVYVGDLDLIAADESAGIGSLNGQPGQKTWTAAPLQAPPTANPLAATVDIYYTLANDKANFKPGQRVGATLALSGTADALTIPWGAVVHDLQGDTWVYVEKSAGVYKRQRVQVSYVADGVAVLASGPQPGTSVVTEGAIELFGAETGFSK